MGLGLAAFLAYRQVQETKEKAYQLKNEFSMVVDSIKTKDRQGVIRAKSRVIKIDALIDDLQNELQRPLWQLARKIEKVDKELDNVEELLDIADYAVQSLLKPALDCLDECPLSGIKVDDGFNVTYINRYIALLESIQPNLEKVLERIGKVEFQIIDEEGKIKEYQAKLEEVKGLFYEALEYLPIVKTVLGDGSNRFYLLAAQNSTEIRASGGFPGTMGTISITDGILRIGEFDSVYRMLTGEVPYDVAVTGQETQIFGAWIYAPRDACFIADYARVAQIWARSFEEAHYNAVHVDGVFSLTPAIIQKVLSISGEITISDGTVLNGENATKVLQHDIYHTYFSNDYNVNYSNDYVDGLFGETAKLALHSFMSKFDLSSFKAFYEIFKEGVAEKIVMMWMSNPEEQEVIRSINASGELNYDSKHPFTGVYFSLADACKLGWYLDINTAVGEPVVNPDGTKTYRVNVDFVNNATPDLVNYYNYYLMGSEGGAMCCFIHFFAPAGGYISNYYISNGSYLSWDNYKGCECIYSRFITLGCCEVLTVSYDVTVAADAEDDLYVVTTPTLTKYR